VPCLPNSSIPNSIGFTSIGVLNKVVSLHTFNWRLAIIVASYYYRISFKDSLVFGDDFKFFYVLCSVSAALKIINGDESDASSS